MLLLAEAQLQRLVLFEDDGERVGATPHGSSTGPTVAPEPPFYGLTTVGERGSPEAPETS